MARRGENIHKRKDGRWEGRYIKARTPDRRICWGYIYGTTYAEVKQRLIHKKSEYGGFQLIDKEYDAKMFESICKISSVHKLTYKLRNDNNVKHTLSEMIVRMLDVGNIAGENIT